MQLDNNSRFTIFKDAPSYLEKNAYLNSYLKSDLLETVDYKIVYDWDEDFKKYFRWNIFKIEEISKYYKDMSLFLKNIYWDAIYSNIESSLNTIYKNIFDNIEKQENLFIINISPLEMVILWSIFEKLWAKNIVYNFNRQATINSATKTFEAMLYTFWYKNSPFFVNKNKEIIKKLSLEKFNKEINKSYILFDENNSITAYEYHDIDNYLKWQTWFSIPKNVYRLDKYPDREFLESKNIKNITFFDSDNDIWSIWKYYIENIKKENYDVKFKGIKYNLKDIKNIWFFEDYLVERNYEYLKYKKNILDKTYSSYWNLDKYIDKTKSAQSSNIVSSKENRKKEEIRKMLPLLILYPVLIVMFFYKDLSLPKSWTTTTSWWTNIINTWWSSWGSSLWSSSSSTKSSSSLIKSFWWWGFSKGSSSS